METSQLAAFVEVAQLGSFSLAAEKLHLTQPAVSKRIAALEADLEQKLLDRIGKQLKLTEAGKILLPEAQSLLRHLFETRQALRDISAQIQGPLSLSTSHHIGLHRLPEILRQFSREFPAVQLDIKFVDSEKACAQVLKGEIELAVVTLPLTVWPHLCFETVWHDPLEFVVAQDHELAQHKRISLATLSNTPALLPAEGTFTRDIVTKAFQSADLKFTTALTTNYMETLKSMCAIGLGWSLLPRTMLGEDLAVLQVPGIELERSLGTVVHERRSLSRAALAFMHLLASSKIAR
jgi:DNA-binding transcriptional LysR family regulator